MGFVAIVLCVRHPWVLAIQYALLAVAAGLGLYAIHRGLEIEPPAFVTDAVDRHGRATCAPRPNSGTRDLTEAMRCAYR